MGADVVTNAPSNAGQTSGAPVVPVTINGLSRSNANVTIQLTDQGATQAALYGTGEIATVALERAQLIASGGLAVASDSNYVVRDVVRDAGGALVKVAEAAGLNMRDTARDTIGLVETSIKENNFFASDIIKTVAGGIKNAVDSVLASNRDNVRESYDFSSAAIQESNALVRDSVRSVERQAMESQNLARQTIDQAGRIVDLTETLNEQNTDAFRYGLDKFASTSTTLATAVIQTVEDLDESRRLEVQSNVKAIKELAETVQTGGESINTNVNKIVMVAAVLAVAAVAWRAVS